jgi:hypothetical protein
MRIGMYLWDGMDHGQRKLDEALSLPMSGQAGSLRPIQHRR